MTDRLFQQVKILEPIAQTSRRGDVLVIEGNAQKVLDPTQLPADIEILPGQHLILAPGLVDLYSHSGEPGFEERETLTSLLKAARAGGFVRLNILPDTAPALDRVSSIISLDRQYQQVAHEIPNCPQLNVWGALTEGVMGKTMTELAELNTTNITGWADGKAISNLALVCRLLEYLQPFHRPIALYACDRELRGDGLARSGIDALRFGLPIDPVSSETAALAAMIEIIADLGTPVHLMRISTRRGVELITAAKQRGVKITASTTWLHLVASTRDLATYHPSLKLNPPLGTADDQTALIEGIKSGVLDAIAIEHTPHTYEEKTVAFGEAPSGAIGLELALPILWEHLVNSGKLSALELWQALSTKPAQCLQQTPPTQLILFDPQQTWTVSINTLNSLSHNTSWLGQEIRGKVIN
jgi:dihydroorotase